jgi:hypothetical protein
MWRGTAILAVFLHGLEAHATEFHTVPLSFTRTTLQVKGFGWGKARDARLPNASTGGMAGRPCLDIEWCSSKEAFQ